MYEKIVRNYLYNMSVEDIQHFASKKNITLSTEEAIIIFKFLKNNYQELLKGNEQVLEKIRPQVSPHVYDAAYFMYQEAKGKFLK